MFQIVDFSQTSENTERFVEKWGFNAIRIPISSQATPLHLNSPFLSIAPT